MIECPKYHFNSLVIFSCNHVTLNCLFHAEKMCERVLHNINSRMPGEGELKPKKKTTKKPSNSHVPMPSPSRQADKLSVQTITKIRL
jgi:hypothetical protein